MKYKYKSYFTKTLIFFLYIIAYVMACNVFLLIFNIIFQLKFAVIMSYIFLKKVLLKKVIWKTRNLLCWNIHISITLNANIVIKTSNNKTKWQNVYLKTKRINVRFKKKKYIEKFQWKGDEH